MAVGSTEYENTSYKSGYNGRHACHAGAELCQYVQNILTVEIPPQTGATDATKSKKYSLESSLLLGNIFTILVFNIQFVLYLTPKKRKSLTISRTNIQSNPKCQSTVKILFPFVMIFARVPCAEHVI